MMSMYMTFYVFFSLYFSNLFKKAALTTFFEKKVATFLEKLLQSLVPTFKINSERCRHADFLIFTCKAYHNRKFVTF